MYIKDFNAMLERVVCNGGSTLMPKETIPDVGWFAYCLDQNGTQFGMKQTFLPFR
jgi:predicted enzyme related to lactoylglutathione lyase